MGINDDYLRYGKFVRGKINEWRINLKLRFT